MAENATSKEEDNATKTMRQRLLHYDVLCMVSESKFFSVEKMWQKQMFSLQLSLAATKTSLAVDASLTLPIPDKDYDSGDGHYSPEKHRYTQ